MGPAGQVSWVAGGWGVEADPIPAHSPMPSRTRKTHPNPEPPIHWLPGRLRRSLRPALCEQINEAPDHEQDAEQDRNQQAEASSPSMFRTLHRPWRTGACQYC